MKLLTNLFERRVSDVQQSQEIPFANIKDLDTVSPSAVVDGEIFTSNNKLMVKNKGEIKKLSVVQNNIIFETI